MLSGWNWNSIYLFIWIIKQDQHVLFIAPCPVPNEGSQRCMNLNCKFLFHSLFWGMYFRATWMLYVIICIQISQVPNNEIVSFSRFKAIKTHTWFITICLQSKIDELNCKRTKIKFLSNFYYHFPKWISKHYSYDITCSGREVLPLDWKWCNFGN